MQSLEQSMTIRTDTNIGQLVLANLPGVNTQQAARMKDAFETLGQIQAAAAAREAHPAIPNNVKEELAVPINWNAAIREAHETSGFVKEAFMQGITAADHSYPAHLTGRAHSPILYAMNVTEKTETALSSKMVSLITGEKASTTPDDLAAIKTLARDSAAKDYTLAVHLNGDLAAKAIQSIAELPESQRPRLLIIGDGHPSTYRDQAHANAAFTGMHAGGVFVTPTAPVPTERATPDEIDSGTFTMRSNREAAANLLAQVTDAAVLAKAGTRDPALATLRTALQHDVPVAVVGGARDESGKVTNLDWARPEYAANRKLMQGHAHFEIESNSRPLAFSPNSIPSIDTATVEGMSAFKRMDTERFGQSNEDRPTRLELDPHANKIESDRHGTLRIDTTPPAPVVGGKDGAAAFLAAVEAGTAPRLQASELDLAARQKAMDDRFLHTSTRDTVSAEIRAEFSAISEAAYESVQRYDTYKTAGAGAGFTHLGAEQAASAGISAKNGPSMEEAAAMLAARSARAASGR